MEPDRKAVSSAESTRRELIEGTLRSWIAEPTLHALSANERYVIFVSAYLMRVVPRIISLFAPGYN